jgi:uncharacterized membrane protein
MISVQAIPPFWALGLAYWLHMLATIVWIGGLAALALVVIPVARRYLDAQSYVALLNQIQRRLDPLGWLSLVVLAGTGLFQMSASPHYQGFLAITDRWAVAILTKHLVFIVMIAVSAYLTWGIVPALGRAALLRAKGRAAPAAERLERQEMLLLRLNLLLGIVILGLTALARAS